MRCRYADTPLVVLFVFLGIFVGVMINFFIIILAPMDCIATPARSLHSLVSSDPRYYVESRYIDQSLVYTYFVEEPDGALTTHSVRAGLGKIYERSDVAPMVVVYQSQLISPWRQMAFLGADRTTVCSVNFTVPSGTVQPSYQVG